MGILRSDRVSGLGGANAINGSVFFGRNGTTTVASGNWLTVYSEDDFKFGTGDFTIEYWFYFTGISNSNSGSFQISNTPGGINNANGASTGGLALNYENGCVKGIGNNGWFNGSNSVSVGTWNHAALVRHSGTLQIFTNGAADTSASDSQNYSLTHLAIGGYYSTSHLFQGYISNFRIVKGTAVYSAAFTPPTERLTAIDGTVLLACQSPGNIFQEATGKTLDIRKLNSNDAPPMASRFAPDKGEDHGTTFADNTKFDTLSYMVPPGGTTTERGRSRGVFGGGESPTADNVMDYLNIQSGGRAVDFGDTSITTPTSPAVSSSTRGVFKLWKTPANLNTLEYITIATTSNSTDFGDLINGIEQQGTASNATRGLFAGGLYPGSQAHNPVEYITIATTGNGTDFGDLSGTVTGLDGTADTTRAVFAGGIGPGSPWPALNTIEYFTIATTGNATDFGDLNYSARNTGSTGDSTRGVWMGGTTPSLTNIIGYVTIQTTGNATDFGDLITASADIGATSNSIRGIMGAGVTPSRVNTIEQIIIQSIGNASDFGDLTRAVSQLGACSDSHGGIS